MTTAQRPRSWIKSSASYEDGNCVEVSSRGAGVHVRDSKHPTGPRLRFPAEMWDRFVEAAATGRIDRTALCAAPDWVGARSGGGAGPEAAVVAGAVGLRDGGHREGPVLIFTPAEWDAFIIGAKQGELRAARAPLVS